MYGNESGSKFTMILTAIAIIRVIYSHQTSIMAAYSETNCLVNILRVSISLRRVI